MWRFCVRAGPTYDYDSLGGGPELSYFIIGWRWMCVQVLCIHHLVHKLIGVLSSALFKLNLIIIVKHHHHGIVPYNSSSGRPSHVANNMWLQLWVCLWRLHFLVASGSLCIIVPRTTTITEVVWLGIDWIRKRLVYTRALLSHGSAEPGLWMCWPGATISLLWVQHSASENAMMMVMICLTYLDTWWF